jgi:hypothetical protein
MPRIIRVTPEEIEDMLSTAAAKHGLTLQQVDELWFHEDPWRLDIPELRDLWLIWRDTA